VPTNSDFVFMGTPRPFRPLHRGFRRVPAEGRRAVFRTEMRPHLVSHFIQQLFAGHAVPLAGNVRAYCGIAGDPIDASHNRLRASTSHMQSVCSHRVQLPLSLEWPIAASFGLLGGIIAAECGDTAPSRIVRGDFAKTASVSACSATRNIRDGGSQACSTIALRGSSLHRLRCTR
jgi:hypothetical protein